MKKVKDFIGVTMFFLGWAIAGSEPITPYVPGWAMTLVAIAGLLLMMIGVYISGGFNEEDE